MDKLNGWVWHVPDTLSQDEEDDLARKSHDGDMESAARLVEGNIRLVLSLASRMARSKQDKDDLVGEGLLGAWVAAMKFDPSHGVKFCTYAVWWIKSYMVQYVKKSRKEMKDSPNTFRIGKEICREYLETGRNQNDARVRKSICERMQISEERFQELMDAMRCKKLHLDLPVFEGGPTLTDCIAVSYPLPDEECVAREEREIAKRKISDAFSVLSERETNVIKSTMNEETLESVGKRLGVSKQRVKQISDRAFRKMRNRVIRSNFHDRGA